MIDHAVILAVGNVVHRSQLIHLNPRPMLPAVGKPLVIRVMDRLFRSTRDNREGGSEYAKIKHFTVIVGMNEGEVTSYLNTTWVPDVKIEFLIKSGNDSLLTMLQRAAKQIDRPFLIANYNCFTHHQFITSLQNQHKDSQRELILVGAKSSLSASRKPYYAAMEGDLVKNIVTIRPQQPHFLAADMAMAGEDFVHYLANVTHKTPQTFTHQLMDIFHDYAAQTEARMTLCKTSWILQVESDMDLLLLNKQLLNEGNDAHILSELPYTVRVIPPVRIDPQVSVGQGAVIGPHVYLEKGSHVGREAVVSNAIVLHKASIPAGHKLTNAIVTPGGVIRA